MCFGSKSKHIQDDDVDAAARPAGYFPAQPTYAAAAPTSSTNDPPKKSSVPPAYIQQQPQKQQQPSYANGTSSAGPPPAELHSPTTGVNMGNPPAELSGGDDFAPPPGPPPAHTRPPGYGGDDYAPPPGPPPPQSRPVDDYAPPPGPPPPQSRPADDFAPPPGPPPSSKENAKQHDWQAAVPDTSLFPPPPALFSGFYRSPTSNATEAESNAGEAWCAQYPLLQPQSLDAPSLALLRSHDPHLIPPGAGQNSSYTFRGNLTKSAPGVWHVSTAPESGDACIVGYPPLYLVREHNPLATGHATTVYYEVKILRMGRAREASVALGFTAMPYPTFRMPGWHRGSLAVHSDDGHKYINDTWGGKAFTKPFREGETVGVGMTFKPVPTGNRVGVEVFLVRDGGRTREGWDLHEEADAVEDREVTGLEGFHDLTLAVGMFRDVEVEIVLDPKRWVGGVTV
ncbi:SPRY domain-containing protein [Echria macrotheca]|uniref:SPRY domain-containing protein n=1 Tax=Echria macrotheca TaxID=438768 RepID=A0AAJ0B8U0_9PEZI|nr:SPRY domain-containing protein [Echria macrotheca]